MPTGVAPSSGRQVLCGYDKTLHADIIFTPESGRKRLVITNDIKTQLKKYGDERSNPRNREQVEEIHVYSPFFKFDHELIFVDTPGLDAYNLGIHEEITLKLVLPTVDMIMFLTNVKCDSDGQNLEFIDRSTSEIKPLVVVQNKINSLSAKISKRGVEKTVDEIKQEHFNRLQRLLSNAQKESVRNAPIVQVSANAPTWELANLEGLRQILAEQIKLNSSFREKLFLRQFICEIRDTQTALTAALAESREKSVRFAERQKVLAMCLQHIQTVENACNALDKWFLDQVLVVKNVAKQLLSAIDSKYLSPSSPVKSGKTYRNPECLAPEISGQKEKLSQLINTVLKNFSETIPRIQNAIKIACSDLNLQESQVVRTEFFGTPSVSISGCQKVIKGAYHPARRVKQSGFGGGVKRFLGSIFGQDDWGYDDIPAYYDPDTTECDIPQLIAEIKRAVAHLEKFLSEKFPQFKRNTEYSVTCLRKEYNLKYQEMQVQFKVDIPFEHGSRLAAALQKIHDGNAGETTAAVPQNTVRKYAGSEENLQETDVGKLVFDTLKVAENTALECHWSLMQDIIRKSGMKKMYICGWDINCMENFRDIFFRTPGEITLVDFSVSSCRLPNENSLIFLLVNAEQSGSSAGKIKSGKVSDFLSAAAVHGRIVWVMDSVDGFISESDLRKDTLIEAYIEMLNIARDVQKKQKLFEVMACSRELYYTVLLHELYFNLSHSSGERMRQHFVEEMAEVFHLSNERKHATGQYVNHFINCMKG